MALPTAAVITDALNQLQLAALEDPTATDARRLFNDANSLVSSLRKVGGATYAGLPALPASLWRNTGSIVANVTEVTMSDEAYADVAALVAAQELSAGDVFRLVNAAADLTDNALATAKGGATAAGDVYGVLPGATAVAYLGTFVQG